MDFTDMKYTLKQLWLICLTCNFIYAACSDQNWLSALERSYFQIAPFIMVWVAQEFGIYSAAKS